MLLAAGLVRASANRDSDAIAGLMRGTSCRDLIFGLLALNRLLVGELAEVIGADQDGLLNAITASIVNE
jgi:hypothetical protein